MKRRYQHLALATITGLLALPTIAAADTISPDTFNKILTLGESYTLRKTVTIEAGGTTTAKVDVMFLFDTTGSMNPLISSAKTNASTILTGLSGYGDVGYAVADYRDFPTLPFGDPSWGDYPYALMQNITTTSSNAQAAIDSLSTGNGYDTPESNLYALEQAATTTSWRTDSTRFVVWFGDAPGHVTGDTGAPYGYPAVLYPSGVSVANTISALEANNVTVEAINLGGSGAGIDGNGGQASLITAGTGGVLQNSAAPGEIVDLIDNAILESFATYGTVSLGLSDLDGNVGVAYTPVSYIGSYDRSVDRTFTFDITFTGLSIGTDEFYVNALVDGGSVASEFDRITVQSIEPVPEPATLLLMGTGLVGLVSARRRKKA